MNKKQFIEAMTELISLKEDTNKASEAFEKLDPDFNFITLGRHETLIVNLIKMAVGDSSDWVGYWLYELDCGESATKDSVQFNGKPIPIKTLDNLYDLIKGNHD